MRYHSELEDELAKVSMQRLTYDILVSPFVILFREPAVGFEIYFLI